MNSILHVTKLRASTSLRACTVRRGSHVRLEFEKESDSGTSVAFDRGNMHVVATGAEIIRFIFNCPFHQ